MCYRLWLLLCAVDEGNKVRPRSRVCFHAMQLLWCCILQPSGCAALYCDLNAGPASIRGVVLLSTLIVPGSNGALALLAELVMVDRG